MTLKLDKLPDRQAVKFTFTASPDLKAALNDYAEIYRRAYGQKKSEGAPDFRVYAGRAELGAAWKARRNGEEPRDYLSVQHRRCELSRAHPRGVVRGERRSVPRPEPAGKVGFLRSWHCEGWR